jgi:hypothetical protein
MNLFENDYPEEERSIPNSVTYTNMNTYYETEYLACRNLRRETLLNFYHYLSYDTIKVVGTQSRTIMS